MARDPAWRRYLRFFGPDAGADLDDEMTFHLEMMVREYERQGLSPAEARARASREFGDIRRAKALCARIDRREQRQRRRGAWLGGLAGDTRFGWRVLRRSPGFSLLAILTLAVGLGATVAMFSVVNGVLLRPLAFQEPDRLVRLWEVAPDGDDRNVVSEGNYLDWRARATSFTAIGAHSQAYTVALTSDGEPTNVLLTGLTPAAVQLLGVKPLLGRLFTREDAERGDREVLLSFGLWRDRYGADPNIVGRTLTIEDRSHTVVGVMGPDFVFPSSGVDLWRLVPDGQLDPTSRRSHNWEVVGRLKSGVAIEQARSELHTIAATLAKEYPADMKGWSATVVPLQSDLVAGVRPLLLVLLAGVALVLLIACANVANLLLARGLVREREVAVRGALGAGRGRLVRQLLVEGAMLAVAAGLAGLGLAAGLLRLLLRLAPADLPRTEAIHLDPVVLGFAGAITLASTLLFGLVPAFRLSATSPQATLRAGGDRSGGTGHARLRSVLLVGEVALSLVLLIGAGLLVRSFVRLQQIDYGFRTADLLVVPMSLPRARYPDGAAQRDFYERALRRVAAVPGVERVGSTSQTPAVGGTMTYSFAIEGRESPNPSGRFDPVPLEAVMPGYFGTLGIPVERGRAFDPRDRADAPPVAIVNRTLARRLWNGADPVGRRIQFREGEPWIEVVGVVGDARMLAADVAPTPIVYLPYPQKTWDWLSWQTLLIRTRAAADPKTLIGPIRRAITELDPRLPIDLIGTADELYAQSMARRRFATVLLATFAGVALLLGVVGLYGVLAQAVAQRRQELAIRMALGAGRGRVVRLVLRQALALTAVGLALGALAALGLSRLLASLLYEISPFDPVTFVVVPALLALVALAAAVLPARRAGQVDPLAAMRES